MSNAAIVCLCQHILVVCECGKRREGEDGLGDLFTPSQGSAVPPGWSVGLGKKRAAPTTIATPAPPPGHPLEALEQNVQADQLWLELRSPPRDCFTNYLVMEKCCTIITQRNCVTHKCYYSKIGACKLFCWVWGHFLRYVKQLVCTWFVSKKTFAHE